MWLRSREGPASGVIAVAEPAASTGGAELEVSGATIVLDPAGVDVAGGYTVADAFVPRVETAMLPYNGIRNTRYTRV